VSGICIFASLLLTCKITEFSVGFHIFSIYFVGKYVVTYLNDNAFDNLNVVDKTAVVSVIRYRLKLL
jgi:hypothetical protein